MYCRLKDEFEWLIEMFRKGNCFNDWEDVAKFIDGPLLELRYMKKDLVIYSMMSINILKRLMDVMLFLLIKRTNLFGVNLTNQHFMELMKTNHYGMRMEQLMTSIILILPFLWKTQSVMRLSF